MHKNVAVAVMRLQRRLNSLSNSLAAEQTEQALNLLLNQPDNPADPGRQVRNAMSEAGKKLSRRRELLRRRLIEHFGSTVSNGLEWLLAVELDDFLDKMAQASDRMLLRHALHCGGAEGIASELGISIDRARERLSRARRRALPLWLN